MRKRRAITAVLAGLVGVAALPPEPAAASAYSQVLQAYQSTGSVTPCRFSSPQLAAALRGIDTYGQQYFADFADAVQSALAARAAGACAPGTRRQVISAAPQAPLPSSPTAATGAELPVPMLALAGLTVLLALTAGGAALLRRGGFAPGWAVAWRHAWAEAEYRLSAGLADLSDRWRRR